MPKRKSETVASTDDRSNRSRKNGNIQEDPYDLTENENHYDLIFTPNENDSGESDDYDVDDEEVDLRNNLLDFDFDSTFPSHSYHETFDNYNNFQKKLEENYKYVWVEGEKMYKNNLKNENFLSKNDKEKILASSHAEIFENFFSSALKRYVIEATRENGYNFQLEELNVIIGIIIFTTYNKRSSQRDYWSKDPCLKSEIVSQAMSRNKFELIKSKLKYSKKSDKDDSDKIWRVHKILDIFKRNIMKFGIFSTAISVDEMMIRYFGRCVLKQFIKGKPIRFGIKM